MHVTTHGSENPEYVKESYKSVRKEVQQENGQKTKIKHCTEEETEVVNKHVKRGSTSLLIKESQI